MRAMAPRFYDPITHKLRCKGLHRSRRPRPRARRTRQLTVPTARAPVGNAPSRRQPNPRTTTSRPPATDSRGNHSPTPRLIRASATPRLHASSADGRSPAARLPPGPLTPYTRLRALLGATEPPVMTRFFNIAGPNRLHLHYTLPVLARIPDMSALVAQESWFILHAPRQSGKATAMRALAAELTSSGNYAALCTTCEAGEPLGADRARVERILVDEIVANAALYLDEALRPPLPRADAVTGNFLAAFLRGWCGTCPRPVVLLLDEIDALRDDALISVLRQLRRIYPRRRLAAPVTLALIGLRDVRRSC